MLNQSNEAQYFRPFGSVTEAIHRAENSLIEQLGMVYAWAYDKHAELAAAKKDNKSADEIAAIKAKRFNQRDYLQLWHEKEYWDRYSSCSAAEHAWVKLQILGLEPNDVAGINPETFSQASKALIAYIEHNRWMAERLLMGWSYGERSDSPPRRPSLCPKGELSADELEKDFAQIQAMCEYFVEMNGI